MRALFYFNKTKLTFEKVKAKTYLYILGILLLVFLLGRFSNTATFTSVVRIITHKPDTLIIHGQPFSENALIELLKDCNLKYPYIVLAQAKLESSRFSSKIFRQNHNMFGMRKARQRITAAQSEKDTYAFYRDWIDCVYDYGLWQSNIICNVSNEDEYFAKLSERYAEDPMYVLKLKKLIKDEKLKSIFEE